MGQILASGIPVVFDDADSDLILSYRWHKHVAGKNVYARGYPLGKRSSGLVYMHRLLTDAPKGTDVDHRNGNGMDNRRGNIRICSRSQNNANRKVAVGVVGIKGVYWDGRCNVWRAEIHKDGVKHRLGRFKRLEDAADAYRQKSLSLYGNFSSHA